MKLNAFRVLKGQFVPAEALHNLFQVIGVPNPIPAQVSNSTINNIASPNVLMAIAVLKPLQLLPVSIITVMATAMGRSAGLA